MQEPLLDDPEKGKKDFVDELEEFIDVYHTEQNDFKRHVDLALRASLVATVGSLVFIMTETPPNDSDDSYWRNKFSVVFYVGPGTLLLYVYTMYYTVGDTTMLAWQGTIGTIVSSLNIWVAYGFFPDGAQTSDMAKYFGWFNVVFSTFLVNVLNVSVNFRMFFLSYVVYNWMDFLNEDTSKAGNYNTGFSLDNMKGNDIVNCLSAVIGTSLAVVATVIPHFSVSKLRLLWSPFYAIELSHATSQDLMQQLLHTWTNTINVFCESDRNYVMQDELGCGIQLMKDRVDQLASTNSSAWWEAAIPKQHRRLDVLNALRVHLVECYQRLTDVLHSVTVENFSEVHDAFMPQVKEEMLSVIRAGHVLMQRAARSAVDGNTDPSAYDSTQVTEAIKALSVKFAEKREEAEQGGQQNETLSESNVGLHACAFADGAARFAKICEGLSGQRAGQDLFSDRVKNCKNRITWAQVFDLSTITDIEKRRFFLNNSLALIISFIIGRSWTNVTNLNNPECASIVSILASSSDVGSAMVKNLARLEGVVLGVAVGKLVHAITSYCTNPECASIVSILASCSDVGSAMVKNMARLEGVVLGVAVGKLVHAITSYCTWYGNLLTICSFSVFLASALLVYFDSKTYSYVGLLLAAYGTQMFMSGCAATEVPVDDAKALWKISVDTIGALALLTIGDFFVEVKKPSEKATDALYQTLSLSAKAVENLAYGDKMWPDGEAKLLSDQVLGSVDVAEACGGHANLEPRFTQAPWKMPLFTQAITHTRKIGVVLAAMEWAVSEGNSKEWSSEFLEARKSPEFEKMFKQLVQELNGVKNMVKGEFDPRNNTQAVERELKTGDDEFEALFQGAASSSLGDGQRLETILDSVSWTCNPRPENLAFDFRSMASALLDNAGTLESETLNLAHAILSE
eukprot:CAMPEP_0194549538 /NCGR_PEP_ID=MMETSP0253-20130528/95257_1 /TAXON_ID=2966 /ORGANISM="Noctiluca scintillans" /LENGTH=910 /DNA_ID=CAMNT_0039396967 /DNA_START=65 /DNA_END=2797 /DNA_ORIENTATION=-